MIKYLCISALFISGCQVITKISSIEYQPTQINSELIKSNAALDSIIRSYRFQMDQKMNDTIAFAEKALSKKHIESELGNWVADAMQWYIRSSLQKESDIAICNYGGLRIRSLPEGHILLRHMYELMPFENELVLIDLDSNELKMMMNIVMDKGGWPISKGFYMNFSADGKILNWTVHGTKSNQYTVLISDYLANGGDGMKFLKNKKRQPLTLLLRNALIEYAKYQKNLHAQIEGRIKQETDA